MGSRRFVLSLALLLACTSCSRDVSYEVNGQIVAVDLARQELTVKHGDIKGFMPGMTMPFKVRDASLMSEKVPEIVRARLVVEDSIGYLTSIDVIGRAPLSEPPPSRTGAAMLSPGETAPNVQLIDQDGSKRQLSDWRGRVVAVTFIYTRCPLSDFCPLMDKQFAEIQREAYADDRLKDRLQLVSVSIDPSFDTPPVLLAHARSVGAQPAMWSFVTGERDELTRFGARFGVSLTPGEAGAADIIHNLRTAVIDPEGRLTTIFGGSDWRAADLLKELRRAGGID